jgi:heat shock protein HslJ
MRHVALVLAGLLTAAGCGGGVGAGSAPDPLRGRTFTATAITEQGAPRPLAAGTSIELRFTDDGRLLARAGCNTMSGPVSLGGGKLTTTELSMTDMGCDPPRHEQDRRMAEFLGGAPAWRLDGENLVLSSTSTRIVLAEQKDLPLLGTTWTADTLIQGQTAGSTPAGVSATLVFGADEVTVTGLCNLHAVTYRATADTITFEPGPLTRRACEPGIMTVENAAVGVLDGRTGYRIDTRTLTITKGDKGLRFTGG